MSDQINPDSLDAVVARFELAIGNNTDTLRRVERNVKEIHEQQITNAANLNASLTWQVKHEMDDKLEFGRITSKLDELKEFRWKLAGAIVLLATVGGWLVKYLPATK